MGSSPVAVTGPILWKTVMFEFDCDLFAQTCRCYEFRNTADRYRRIVWKKDTSWVKEPESFLVSKEELEDTQSEIW